MVENAEPIVDLFQVTDPSGCVPLTAEQFIANLNRTANFAGKNLDFTVRNFVFKVIREFEAWTPTATAGGRFMIPEMNLIVVKLDMDAPPKYVKSKDDPVIATE
jgi:hypothetical protein